ncbi:DUF4386 domain-containing protein [Microbacterium sp. HD4P20]|uniref:DUF4386 domain-containing protein n=1 Tax=Microbacterium sp. HD4P20 TaxID=2864874 RepID=UPI001C63F407|nr:DUF4386 domain-containing protein [Microbacterium sp. HD4P20]MCP2635848.1 DUF4386 domain-containing protein [Microbacterium sp. HD4P20]
MNDSLRVARWTGVAYLALALCGMAGFLILRPQLHDADDAAGTLANLQSSPALAHLGVGLELAVVAAQALAALGFYALFRHERPVAGFAVAIFGMANASAILASAAMLATAAQVAGDPSLAGAAAVGVVALLYAVADSFWLMGGLFFGLWLIPMGSFVLSTGRMPRALGWALVAGGAGYVISTALQVVLPSTPVWLIDGLPLLATVGELWMVAYLLIRGIRPARAATPADPAPARA